MVIPRLLRLFFAAGFASFSGAAAAQEFSARLAEVHAAPVPSVWGASPAALAVPSAALSPALTAPSAALVPSAFVFAALPAANSAPAKPSVGPAAATPSAAPDDAPAEDVRANGQKVWDGAGDFPRVADFKAVRNMASPFRTETQLAKLAASPRPAGPLRFAVIGDAEPGRFWIWRKLYNRDRNAFWKMLPMADASGSEFIQQLGDMVSRGILRFFRPFFKGLLAAGVRTPYLTVIGNHDRHSPHGTTNSVLYRALFGETDYFFDRGGRRFVVLDNSAGEVSRGQLDWLRSVLSGAKSAVVFTHMPPAPLGEFTNFIKKGSGGFRRGA
ncbi:MAG: metallophosphoesterase, partial [Elusimicrobiota bacterium]